MKLNAITLVLSTLLFSACSSVGTHANSVNPKASDERTPSSRRFKSLSVAGCLAQKQMLDAFECLDATLLAEDDKLNVSYNKLLDLLKANEPDRIAYVRKAQLAWIKLRDADCFFDSRSEELGESSTADSQICKIKQTQDRRALLDFRVVELRKYLKASDW